MSKPKILLLALAIAGLSAFAGYSVKQQSGDSVSADPAQARVGSAKASRGIKDLMGRERLLSEWTGKILVVNFWATWCPPCVKEIPAFVELQSRLGGRGLQFVGIALDDPTDAGKFATERAVNYPILAGDEDVAALMLSLGNTIGALPYTVVFDRAGKPVHHHQGEWTPQEAVEVLEPLLNSPQQQVAR